MRLVGVTDDAGATAIFYLLTLDATIAGGHCNAFCTGAESVAWLRTYLYACIKQRMVAAFYRG